MKDHKVIYNFFPLKNKKGHNFLKNKIKFISYIADSTGIQFK